MSSRVSRFGAISRFGRASRDRWTDERYIYRHDFPITIVPCNVELFFPLPIELRIYVKKKAMRQCHRETSGRIIKILDEFTGKQSARVKWKVGTSGVLSENEESEESTAK